MYLEMNHPLDLDSTSNTLVISFVRDRVSTSDYFSYAFILPTFIVIPMKLWKSIKLCCSYVININ